MVTTRGIKSRKEVARSSPSPEASSSRKSKSRKSGQKNLSVKNKSKNEYTDEQQHHVTSPENSNWSAGIYSDDEEAPSFHSKDSESILFKSDPESSSEDDYEVESSQLSARQLKVSKIEESSEEAFCPWLEIHPDKLPTLELPASSSDLLIESQLLFDVLEIYEICQVYYRTIQISPFLFEDFLCSLRSSQLTKLIAEIHIAFIKLLLRDDEDEQTTFSVQDTNNSFNIMCYLLEPMTYAEVLRQYVESDPTFPEDILNILQGNYPFVDVNEKIMVLKWLCERFLSSNIMKKIIKHDGKMHHDEHCRECGKPGDVLLCDGCEACFHLFCAGLQEIPVGDWFCKVCKIHQIRGVLDCLSFDQKSSRQLLRMKPIGFDRHGRLYWFLVRRIFVQDSVNNRVYYYSTLPQVYELISRLDSQLYEAQLCQMLNYLADQIAEQMMTTIELTDTKRKEIVEGLAGSRDIPEPYLHVDNVDRMSRIFPDIVASSPASANVLQENNNLVQKFQRLLYIEDGVLTDNFWSGGLNEDKIVEYRRVYNDAYHQDQETLDALQNDRTQQKHRGFRLGFSDGGYRNYENQYQINEYAKSPYMRAKDRDRKKYLSLRFSITDDGLFDWPKLKEHGMFKSADDVAIIIQYSLRRIIQKVPDELMHRLWKSCEKEKFIQSLHTATTVDTLRYHLLLFEKAARKPIFSNIWWNSLGLTRLQRTTPADREARQALEARKKKEERDLQLADPFRYSNFVWVKYASLGGPPKHNIYKLKDEQYRVNGFKKLGGWIWISSTRVYRHVCVPSKPPLGLTTCDNNTSIMVTPEAKKALRLEKLVQKLNRWRKESEVSYKTTRLRCYSSSCQMGVGPIIDGVKLNCYSPTCSQIISCSQALTSTSAIVKAFDPAKKIAQRLNSAVKEIMGEGKPFPFPKPFGYKVKATGKRSILILPQAILRRIARLSTKALIPGFHYAAKANFVAWNYPCPRPLFDNCWRYVTLNSNSLAAIALQFRILYACIRWHDMKPGSDVEDERDPRVVVHYPDYDEIRSVIGHRENPPDGYYEQYKLKLEQYFLDDSLDQEGGDYSENYRATGGPSLRARKRKQPKEKNSLKRKSLKNMKCEERWIDGVELKLFEIKRYWQTYNRLHSQPNTSNNMGVFSRALSAQKTIQDTEALNRSRFVVDKALNASYQQSNIVIRPYHRLTNVSSPQVIVNQIPSTSNSSINGYYQTTDRRPDPIFSYQPLNRQTSDTNVEHMSKRIRLDSSILMQEPQERQFIIPDESGVQRKFVMVKPSTAGIRIQHPGGATINQARSSMSSNYPLAPKFVRVVQLEPAPSSSYTLPNDPINQTYNNGQPTISRTIRPHYPSNNSRIVPMVSQPIRFPRTVQRIVVPVQSYDELNVNSSGSISRASFSSDHDYAIGTNQYSAPRPADNYEYQNQPNQQQMLDFFEPTPKSAARKFYEEKLKRTLLEASRLNVYGASYSSFSKPDSYDDDAINSLVQYEQSHSQILGPSDEPKVSTKAKKPAKKKSAVNSKVIPKETKAKTAWDTPAHSAPSAASKSLLVKAATAITSAGRMMATQKRKRLLVNDTKDDKKNKMAKEKNSKKLANEKKSNTTNNRRRTRKNSTRPSEDEKDIKHLDLSFALNKKEPSPVNQLTNSCIISETCASQNCKKPIAESLNWVQCDDCCAWYHTFCILGKEIGFEEDESFSCGCKLQEKPTKKKLTKKSTERKVT